MATARTQASLSNLTSDGVVSFTLNGFPVSADVETTDLANLVAAINQQTGKTGVTASLSIDKQSLTLEHPNGEDISILNFTVSAATSTYPVRMNFQGDVMSPYTRLEAGGANAGKRDSAIVGGKVEFKSSAAANHNDTLFKAINMLTNGVFKQDVSTERFRIALARAILRDPTIMVIEEPSNGLADEDKVWFDDTLSRFLHGRTAILLPHRLSTIRKADRVVLLQKGVILDQGADADMIRRNVRYKHWEYLRFHSFQDDA